MPESTVGRILIVEDDPQIVELLKSGLRDMHYELESAADGLTGLAQIETGNYILVILDLNLPGLSGFDVCRKARAGGSRIPILILSSRSDEVDKVLGLQLGADDFLSKPFSIHELSARVVALLRRAHIWSAPERPADNPINHEELTINPRDRTVRVAGQLKDLSPIEYDLLFLLASEPGRVFSKQELLSAVWGDSNPTYLNVIGPHISRLRSKIEQNPSNPKYLRTTWGVGYFFGTRGKD